MIEIENKLWDNFKINRSTNNRNKLVEFYIPFVKKIAIYQSNKTPSNIQLDDLISAGYLGLFKAIECYDPTQAQFKTYAKKRILGAMIDWMRKFDTVSRVARDRRKNLQKAKNSFISINSRNPGDDELREFMGIEKSEFSRLVKDSNIHETYIPSDHNEETKYLNAFRYDDYSPKRIDDIDEIEFILEDCDPEESTIIILYYYKGLTMSQISLIMGTSASNISRIHKNLLERLKDRLIASA